MRLRRFCSLQSFLLTSCAAAALCVSAASRAEEADQVGAATTPDAKAAARTGDAGQVIIESTKINPDILATELKRAANNIKDVAVSDEIRRLPDTNIAEALERIPGISMESDSGQGRFINIRGFDADLNGSYFDGVHLTANNQNASPMGGGRAVAFDAFPAGLVGGLEVVKSLTPDMDAEGIGGQVNMLSHSLPIGGKPFVEMDVGGGYEPLRGSPIWNATITAGGSFGLDGRPDAPKPFRLIGTFAYDEDHRGIDDFEEFYDQGGSHQPLGGADERWYEYHRVRQGGTVELDYDPNDRMGFYVKGVQSGYWESAQKHELLLRGLDGGNGSITANPDGTYSVTNATAKLRFIDTAEHIQTSVITAGGHLLFGTAELDLQGGWTKGIDVFTHSYNIDFTQNSAYNLTYSDSSPSHRIFTVTSPGVSLSDPTQYSLSKVSNQPSQAYDQEYSSRVDLILPVAWINPDDQAKIGGSVRLRNRGADQQSLTGRPSGTLPLSGFTNTANVVFYNNYYNIGPDINHEAAIGSVAGYTADPTAEQGAFARNTENVYAGYAQYTANFGLLTIVGGLRIEATKETALANSLNADTNLYSLNSTSQSYTNYFPSFQGKYQLIPELQLRASYSSGIARPGFNELSANTTVSQANLSVTTGNPNLKPMTADAVDLGLDYDLPGGGTAGAGLFYKNFTNYIISRTYIGSYQGLAGYTFGSYLNLPAARADGVELQFRKPFTFLPAPFQGFGLEGNYTFIDSQTTLRPGEKKVRLPQTSPENGNLAFFYNEGPIDARIAASYVSSNLYSIGGDRSTDTFSNARFRLDAGAAYAINDHFQIYFDVKNLTNTKLQFNNGSSPDNPIQREFYDVSYYGGLRAKF